MSFHVTLGYKNVKETLDADNACLAFIFLHPLTYAPNNENMKTNESVIVSFKWFQHPAGLYIMLRNTLYAAELLNRF